MNKKFGAFSERKFRGGNEMDSLAWLKRRFNTLLRAESGGINTENLDGDIVGNRFIAPDADGNVRMIMSSDSLIELIGVAAYLAALKTDGTVTFYVDADTGALTAGAGVVTLDANGIRIAIGSGSSNSIQWMNGANLEGYINTDSGAAGATLAMIATKSGYANEVVINGYGDGGGGSENSLIRVTGGNTGGTRGQGYARIGTTDYLKWSPAGILINADSKDIDTIIKGDTTDVITVDAALEKAIITKQDVTGNLNIAAASITGGFKTIYKAADESMQSDTALSTDADLVFNATENKTYAVRGRIWFSTAAAADFKFRFTFSGTSIWMHIEYNPCGSGSPHTESIETASPTTTISALGTGTVGGFVEFDGVLVCDGSARAFAFQWAQNTSTASPTVVKAGSYLEYVQVD